MLIQRGHFLIKNISELETIPKELDGIRRIIDLDYMGKFEFEGNAVIISRMFIEYYNTDYQFYETNIKSSNNKIMYLYLNSKIIENRPITYINKLAQILYDREYSIYEYVKNPEKSYNDFWWDINNDYLIFFGEEKIELIKYFIDNCYYRDGGKEEIQKKLVKVGYKI